MSLIERQAAIDAIEKESQVDGAYGYMDTKSIVDCLNDLPSAQPDPMWIPCCERLPEDKTAYYLATVANHGLSFTTTLNNNVECVRWDYDRRKGQDSWHWCTERTVIAWMPLPEPYREDGDKL